jgi:hypothetical protein
MANSTFSIRIDSDIKREFDVFCAEVGMNPSTAFNMFPKFPNFMKRRVARFPRLQRSCVVCL